MSDVLPITGIPREGLPRLALVTGDPGRIATIAEILDDARQIASRREYVTCTGSWKGTKVVATSHGVGAPGAMLAFQELAAAGVTTFIRAGTCGALAEHISDGDLVIATGAVRQDGVTDQMVPPTYPAVSAPEVVGALERAATAAGATWHRGEVLTRAAFFPGILDDPLEAFARDGVVAVEMELAALLVMATLKDLRAGGVLVVDGNPLHTTPESYDPHRNVVREGVRVSIEVALDSLHELEATA